MPADIFGELGAYILGGILESIRDRNKWFWSIIILIMAALIILAIYFT